MKTSELTLFDFNYNQNFTESDPKNHHMGFEGAIGADWAMGAEGAMGSEGVMGAEEDRGLLYI